MISQCTYLYAHSILCHWIGLVDIINIPKNISLTALKADSQSEILPKWWKILHKRCLWQISRLGLGGHVKASIKLFSTTDIYFLKDIWQTQSLDKHPAINIRIVIDQSKKYHLFHFIIFFNVDAWSRRKLNKIAKSILWNSDWMRCLCI